MIENGPSYLQVLTETDKGSIFNPLKYPEGKNAKNTKAPIPIYSYSLLRWNCCHLCG
jgi:hypothetical protein